MKKTNSFILIIFFLISLSSCKSTQAVNSTNEPNIIDSSSSTGYDELIKSAKNTIFFTSDSLVDWNKVKIQILNLKLIRINNREIINTTSSEYFLSIKFQISKFEDENIRIFPNRIKIKFNTDNRQSNLFFSDNTIYEINNGSSNEVSNVYIINKNELEAIKTSKEIQINFSIQNINNGELQSPDFKFILK